MVREGDSEGSPTREAVSDAVSDAVTCVRVPRPGFRSPGIRFWRF